MSVSDDFNRADGALGANWTGQQNAPTVSSNTAKGSINTAYGSAYWSANTFNDNHDSQITKANASNYQAPGVRMSSTGATTNWYGYFNHGQVQKRVSGTTSTIATSTTYASGDTARLDANGTTLAWFKNGASVSSVVDSSLTTGYAGIIFYNLAPTLDDWIATGETSASSIKTWNGLADASTKTYNGLARASAKTWNGLA